MVNAATTGEDAQGQDGGAISSEATAGGFQRDPLIIKRMSLLLQFLLHKCKMREPITKAEMMKIINKKYQERFPEVLHRVSEHMELVFGYASGTGADESAQGQDDSASSSGGPQRDPLIKRMSFLLQFLLHKYKLREPITKAEMMKVINKKYKERFPEILQRATEHMELVFGLDLKEVDPESQSYVLTSTVEFSREENLSSGTFPKYGLLMPLLGMMHLSDNQASEEEVWEFLNRLGVYDGKRHFIFGEARKLLTKDLVQEKYLEYRQVPGSHPPCYEFLWGPRAYTEACKTKVLKFLTKLNDVDQNAFQTLYLETWRDEEEREAGTGWPGVGMNARARARFRAKSSKASHSRRV
ncbi:PREDICTED: melanoma-associated antigen B4-like [Elephantulus edwardii]|uniref:melanoma-associated antigen B4-like n=1 Tax=Elephantulus edwardii TaxID=28737 RepID=UPI0003F07315|nr:PREDICTED: melanoma-associated antigen B4-like [Elephantulus edwardii]